MFRFYLLQEDNIENAEDDWVHDPRNPRNWTFWKKWTMAGIVRFWNPFSAIIGR